VDIHKNARRILNRGDSPGFARSKPQQPRALHLRQRATQKDFGNPASFNIPFAVNRDRNFRSTVT
jgi:hypothetical protein